MTDDVNSTLDHFMADDVPKDPTAESEAVKKEAPAADTTEKKDTIEKKDTMVTPSEFSVGDLSDEQRMEAKLRDEDKATEDNEIISNRPFIIESVDMQEDAIRRLIARGEEMQPFNPQKPEQIGYQTRLRIKYENSNYVSLIPSIRWYPSVNNEGKKVLQPWFNVVIKENDLDNSMVSTISKLYFRYCEHVGKEVGKVTQKDFVTGLVGKKVILKQWMTTFQGKPAFRLDVHKFVD